jgi:acyl carrier protein
VEIGRRREKRFMDSVATDTIAIISKRLPTEKRNLQLTDRLKDLGIDSFSAVEMIFDLEEKFDVQISYNSNHLTPEYQTVGDIVDAIEIGGRKIIDDRSRRRHRLGVVSAISQ